MLIRLLDIRQPAITPDLKDVRDRLRIHLPTLVTRNIGAKAVAVIFAAAMIRLTGADRLAYSLPAVAVAGFLGWNHFEMNRSLAALDLRAALLFQGPGDVPEDVKEYIDDRPRVWTHISKEHMKVKLEQYCTQAVKEKRLATAEYMLANKLVKLADGNVDLRALDEDKKMTWLFKYISTAGFDESKMTEFWDIVFRTRENVTDSPLFSELVQDLEKIDAKKRLPIVLRALRNSTEILDFFQKHGVQFGELFSPNCPAYVFEQIYVTDLKVLTKYLTPDPKIAHRLWQKICDLNYINDELYKLYIESTPPNRPDLLKWDLNKATEAGSLAVVLFMEEKGNAKVE